MRLDKNLRRTGFLRPIILPERDAKSDLDLRRDELV